MLEPYLIEHTKDYKEARSYNPKNLSQYCCNPPEELPLAPYLFVNFYKIVLRTHASSRMQHQAYCISRENSIRSTLDVTP